MGDLVGKMDVKSYFEERRNTLKAKKKELSVEGLFY